MYSSNYLYTCIYSIWSEYLFYVTIHILFDWRNHFTCLYTFFLNKVDMWLYVFDQSNHFMWLYVFCSIRVNSLCGSTYSGYFYYLIYWGRYIYILCLVTQSSDCLLSLSIYIYSIYRNLQHFNCWKGFISFIAIFYLLFMWFRLFNLK